MNLIDKIIAIGIGILLILSIISFYVEQYLFWKQIIFVSILVIFFVLLIFSYYRRFLKNFNVKSNFTIFRNYTKYQVISFMNTFIYLLPKSLVSLIVIIAFIIIYIPLAIFITQINPSLFHSWIDSILTTKISFFDLLLVLANIILAVFAFLTYDLNRRVAKLENPEPSIIPMSPKITLAYKKNELGECPRLIRGFVALNDSKHQLLLEKVQFIITDGISICKGEYYINRVLDKEIREWVDIFLDDYFEVLKGFHWNKQALLSIYFFSKLPTINRKNVKSITSIKIEVETLR